MNQWVPKRTWLRGGLSGPAGSSTGEWLKRTHARVRTPAGTGAAALLAAALGACAGPVPWNLQSDAGINRLEARFPEDGMTTQVSVSGGKEQDLVTWTLVMPNGLGVRVEARGQRAFRAHELRAAVEKVVSADVRRAAPGIVDAIIDAILRP